jgi:hypothetical protein
MLFGVTGRRDELEKCDNLRASDRIFASGAMPLVQRNANNVVQSAPDVIVSAASAGLGAFKLSHG